MNKNNIIYQEGSKKDLADIAELHAESWQNHYRGSFRDEYLEGPVFKERLEFWQNRFKKPSPKRHIILAKSGSDLAGFACLFLDENAEWGSLIDNLHVSNQFKGFGIGRRLMELMFQYVREKALSAHCYLWVLIKNKGAIAFYEKLGGKIVETKEFENPGGGSSEVFRIVWNLAQND